MTYGTYNELKELNSKAVLKRLRELMTWEKDKDDEVDNLYMMVCCFALWRIRHNDSYSTVDEYFEYCAGPERGQSFDAPLYELKENGHWNSFVKLKDEFTDEELLSAVIFNKPWEENDPIPEGLLCLVNSLLGIEIEGHVVEYCASSFEHAIFTALTQRDVTIEAYESTDAYRSLGEARRLMLGLDNISIRGVAEQPVISDTVFVSFGDSKTVQDIADREFAINRMTKWRGLPAESSYTRDILLAALSSLSDIGRAVVLVRGSQLSSRENMQIRQFLVEAGYVKGVIALSDKLFERTWVNTYILILEKNCNNIRFCDARGKSEKIRIHNGRQINQLTVFHIETIIMDYLTGGISCRDASYEEVEENDYVLLPQRYISVDKYKETRRLGDCVNGISRGITLSSQELDKYLVKDGMKCITPTSLSNGLVTKHFYFDNYNFNKKINTASRGDILINKSGNPLRTAVVEEEEYAVIGNTYILKGIHGVDPYYIKCFLESPKGQAELMKYMVGENTPMLTIANLQKVEIPFFEEQMQRELESDARRYTDALKDALCDMERLLSKFESGDYSEEEDDMNS